MNTTPDVTTAWSRIIRARQVEPITLSAGIVGVLELVLLVVLLAGVNLDDAQLGLALGAPVTLGPVIGALWARTKATPVADPKDDDGRPLVPGV